MVACGRHCCICHKFCGIKMEVHHIKAEADGGKNTFENAIPLCFDCHAEVRQYDPKHPKGTKFTEKELIQQRDKWYEKVKNESVDNSKSNNPSQFGPLKIYRQKGYENILLRRINTGSELLSFVQGVCAMEYGNDEPQTREEANNIGEFIQLINEIIDEEDLLEPANKINYGYDINDYIKKLDENGFWAFAAIENRKLVGGISEPGNFPTLLIRIVRKDSKEIICQDKE